MIRLKYSKTSEGHFLILKKHKEGVNFSQTPQKTDNKYEIQKRGTTSN